MFSLSTTFDRRDFTRLLVERFQVPKASVEGFFDAARNMNFYDDQATTTGQLFERFFPGRGDVVRLLMEPITYANGSTLEDPALSYGIVFSNFMSKGVYTFQGGTDRLMRLMGRELRQSGVDVRTRAAVEKIHIEGKKGSGPICAKHPPGRSGKLDLTPFSRPGIEGVTVAGRRIQDPRRRLQRQSAGHDLPSRRARALGRRFSGTGPGGPPEQFQHAGLHGPEAGVAHPPEPVRRPAL